MSDETYALNIYDEYAKISRNLDPSEIAKCSKSQQKILFALLASLDVAEKAEGLHYEDVKTTRRAVTALDRSRKAYEKAMPVRTFHDEWRETVAKMPPKVVTKETKKLIADALVEVDKAEAALAECQRAEIASNATEKDKRGTFAKALIAWSAVDGIAKNVGDLVKARGETDRRIAMENIAAGLPADYSVAQASTVGPSQLDRTKAASGRGHSANYGHNRNEMRGATLKPKLPSEV